MQIKELKIMDFGKFHQKNISLKTGINLIYGENETGKSTVHAFIRGMLFGIEKARGRVSKDDTYTRYQPWDSPLTYRGSLDYTIEGKDYRIIRNLEKNQKSISLLDLETGRELGSDNGSIRDMLGGLTESGYVNTVSISQQSVKTGAELAGEVRNYITNLSLAKNNEVDVNKALAFLQGKKKELEGKRPLQELKEIKEQIEKGKLAAQRGDNLMNQLNKVSGELRLIEEKLEQQAGDSTGKEDSFPYEEALGRYPVMEDKLRQYEARKKQIKELAEKENTLREEISKNSYPKSSELKLDTENFRNSRKEKEAIEIERESIAAQASAREKSRKKKALTLISLLLLVSIVILFAGLVSHSLLWLAAIPLLIGTAAVGIYTNRKKPEDGFGERLSNLEARYQKGQKHREDILKKYRINSEDELIALQEASIKAELQNNFKEEQIKGYIGQERLLEENLIEEKKDLLTYLKLIPDEAEKLIPGDYEPEEKDLLKVRTYLTGKKEEQKRAKAEIYKERDRLSLLAEQIKWELNSLADNEENLLFYQEKEKKLLEREEELRIELEAVGAAMETIRSLSQKIHDSFGNILNRKISSLVAELTAGRYSDIRIDENLDIKAEIGEEYRLFDKLSIGTVEQFLFALRLGVSDVLYDKELPLLLDDCFAYYDDKRTKAALAYLAACNRQILLFTCHEREKSILDELGVSYNYINLGEI